MDHAATALALRPERPRPYAIVGLALMKLDRPAEAIPQFVRFLQQVPDSVDVLMSLGLALVRAGRPADGMAPLTVAVTLAPDNVIARVNLAAALVRLGRHHEAMAQYGAALATDAKSSEAHYGLGWASVSAGDIETARRELLVLKTLNVALADTLAMDIAA